jgi:cell division septum initiation protein DivIVA
MATRTHVEKEFERLIDEVRKLRKERAEVQAKLNALPPT